MVEGDHGGTFKDKSFLQLLWDKKMAVRVAGKRSGKDFGAAEREVDRQIKQITKGGANAETGEGVTKSGKED